MTFYDILYLFAIASIPLITLWIDGLRKKKYFELERKEKFRSVAIEKRLEAHQQALNHWNKLSSVIHSPDTDSIKRKTITDARDFWFNNSIYLEKNTRELFSKVIGLVSAYSLFHENLRDTPKGEEKNKLRKELSIIYETIISLENFIQIEVNLEPINTDYKELQLLLKEIKDS